MRKDYPDGGFSLSWQKVIAWYDAQGNLRDCAYKRKSNLGGIRHINVSEKHTKVRKWLKIQGINEININEIKSPSISVEEKQNVQ